MHPFSNDNIKTLQGREEKQVLHQTELQICADITEATYLGADLDRVDRVLEPWQRFQI